MREVRSFERMPMIPLPDVVLFPHTSISLQLFEDRYLQLARQAVASREPVALARLALGHGEAHMPPPTFTIAGYGTIDFCEESESGVFTIGVTGLGRAHLREELRPEHPFREVFARTLPDRAASVPDDFFSTFRAVLLGSRLQEPETTQKLLTMLDVDPPLGVFSDIASHLMMKRSDERQALLEELDPARRLQLLEKQLTRQSQEAGASN